MCGFVGCFGLKLNDIREAGRKISHRGQMITDIVKETTGAYIFIVYL